MTINDYKHEEALQYTRRILQILIVTDHGIRDFWNTDTIEVCKQLKRKHLITGYVAYAGEMPIFKSAKLTNKGKLYCKMENLNETE